MSKVRLEILEFNYWEHFKMAKDFALVYPLDHFKRKRIEEELSRLIVEINLLKKKV